jgi:hypothetical protein
MAAARYTKNVPLGNEDAQTVGKIEMDLRHVLHKFLLEYERLRFMLADVVRRVLFFESKCAVPRQDSGGRGRRKRKRPSASTEDEVGLGKQALGSQCFFDWERWRSSIDPVRV